MRLGSGICRVKEMRALGVNVALGVDGSASNDSSDMLGELRNALMLQRVTKGADALTAADVYAMGTVNGARLLGYDRIGEIRQGWGADLALFDVNRLEYCGAMSDPAAALIFAGFSHGADYTVCNGRLVVDRGRLVGMDEDSLIAGAAASAERLYRRAGL